MAARFPPFATIIGSVVFHIRDWWFRRIPLIFQLLLLGWAPFACFVWPGLLRNVLLIENSFQAFTLSFLCGIAAVVGVSLDHLVECYAPERFHHYRTTRRLLLFMPRWIQWAVLFLRRRRFLNWSLVDWVWAALVGVSAPAFSLWVSLGEQVRGDSSALDPAASIAAAVGGAVTALALVVCMAWMSSWSFLGRSPSNRAIFPSMTSKAEAAKRSPPVTPVAPRALNLLRGYVRADRSTLTLEPGHLFAGAYLFLSALGFGAIAFLDPMVVRFYVSVPFCAVLIFLTCLTTFGAIAFFMDYFRIPLFVFLIFWVSLFRVYFGSDATFEVTKGPPQEAAEAPAEVSEISPLVEFANQRLTHPSKVAKKRGGTLVIVTAPGGGIHAAAWSAKVLAGLSQEYQDFEDSLFLISGVSGGSIGSLHYAAHLVDHDEKALDEVDDRARASSLEAIGVALAFRDLPRNMTPISYGHDRGVELEAYWQSKLLASKESLTVAKWAERAKKGEVPSLVFGSTDVRSGRRVLFATAPIPVRESVGTAHFAPVDFCRLGKDFDIPLVSAARMSATFPFVTPIARPNHIEATPLWLADGGYADNEGIITAIDCVQHLLEQENQWRGFERILLIRIQPNPLGAHPETAVKRMEGSKVAPDAFASSLRWMTGPAEALVNVRSASQLERSELEVELARLERDRGRVEAKDPKERWKFVAASAVQGKANPAAQTNIKQRPPSDLETDSDETVMQKQQGLYVEQWNNSKESRPKESPVRSSPAPVKRAPARQPKERLIVVQIGFLHPEPERPIPLNWKLSPREQRWYDEAWEKTRSLDPAMSVLDEVLQRKTP